jgi:hypothetical protein
MNGNGLGLIELAFVFGGFLLFVFWQMRELKRLKKERENITSLNPSPTQPNDKAPPQK